VNVELLDHMGDDLAVVNAARVSFDKQSTWTYELGIDNITNSRSLDLVPALTEKDQKLIKYLAKEGHWSPFSHTTLKFRIKAPIFVARQLAKHQVGLTWNEVSRRYVDSEPEFYTPTEWRGRAEDKKQGSSDTVIPEIYVRQIETQHQAIHLPNYVDAVYRRTLALYKILLEAGVCPEQARMVLPQSMYTEWIWTGSLLAFSRIYNLRTHENAQQETREIAARIGSLASPLFPYSWDALTNVS